MDDPNPTLEAQPETAGALPDLARLLVTYGKLELMLALIGVQVERWAALRAWLALLTLLNIPFCLYLFLATHQIVGAIVATLLAVLTGVAYVYANRSVRLLTLHIDALARQNNEEETSNGEG